MYPPIVIKISKIGNPTKVMKKIAILTSGGDSQGMNTAVRAVAKTAMSKGMEVFGIKRGYKGMLEDQIFQMSALDVSGIADHGGTILLSARLSSFKDPEVRAKAAENLKKRGIEGLVVIGGDGSFHGAHYLYEEHGIKTHFVKKLNDRDQLCQRVTIFPLEVIVRNIIAGSMAKRVGIKEGTKINNTIFEICYKNDEYGDPLINDHHAVAMGLATYDELKEIYDITAKINNLLKEKFDKIGITLVDFKIEFGKNSKGEILLADEITPDTCRLWDKETGEKLDKDRFRRDLGNIEEAYIEVVKRLTEAK